MATFFKRLLREQNGASMVEYALLLMLIALSLIVVLRTTGVRLDGSFGDASATLAATDGTTAGGNGHGNGHGNGDGHGNGR